MNIFIDTGAFYALADKSDKHHLQSKNYYESNYKAVRFITSNLILAESWTLIRSRLGRTAANTFWEKVKNDIITIYYINPLDMENAWKISQQYPDQDFSLVDCTSFAIMEHLKIEIAFAFDRHYAIFRTRTNHSFICQPSH